MIKTTTSHVTAWHHNCAEGISNALGRGGEVSEDRGLQCTREKRRRASFGSVHSSRDMAEMILRAIVLAEQTAAHTIVLQIDCGWESPNRLRRLVGVQKLDGEIEGSGSRRLGSHHCQVLLPSRVQLLKDWWTLQINIWPMQWHVIMMPPCHCIELFHKRLTIMLAIRHARGGIGLILL